MAACICPTGPPIGWYTAEIEHPAPTTASAGDKLAVAAMVADSHTKAVLGEQTKPQDKKKLHLVAHNAQSALDLIGGS